MWFRVPTRSVLPGRALLKKEVAPDGTVTQIGEVKKHNPKNDEMIHFVPKEYAAETVEFFRIPAKVKALTELIFSPQDPQDTADSRKEYEEAQRDYNESIRFSKLRWSTHEKRAKELCFKAIRELPPDLYSEAILENTSPFPKALMFHSRFNSEIFPNLSWDELVQLQSFENLSHTRFPHSEVKRRSPNLFLVSADTLPSRQKEAALKSAANSRTKAVKK